MIVARRAAALIALWLALVAGPALAARATPDPARQLLVMLRMSPNHFRAGADYGGGYGDLTTRVARMRIAHRIARAHKLRVLDNWPMQLIGLDCVVMQIADGRTPDQVVAELSEVKGIAWAQPLELFHGEDRAAQPDPLLPAQPADRYWRIAELHGMATGRGISIAVIDSRIDAAHPDLRGQVSTMRDFVAARGQAPERHGTSVAGVIAARSDNGIGIMGIAPAARLMALRACWDASSGRGPATICDTLSLAKALHFALEHRAAIINLSLSGPSDRLLAQLIALGLASGTTIVAAVDPDRRDGGFPASLAGVIGVAAQPMVAPAGSFYAAPGRDIPTTGPGGTWLLVNGNSFAAAHVSGLLALAREHAPHRSPTLRRLPDGQIDACRTVACQSPAHDSRFCAQACARP